MKVVLSGLISENQTGFVGDWQSLDGVMTVNEVVCWAKAVQKEIMLLKIDFAKAYNCVNWDFLDSVMEQMRFGVRWHS